MPPRRTDRGLSGYCTGANRAGAARTAWAILKIGNEMEGSAARALSALALGLLAALPLFTSTARAESGSGHARDCVFDHQALRTAPGTCRPHAIAYPSSVRGKVQHAIYDSALIFGVPYRILLKIARCESGLNPRADSGVYHGLFQFLPETFRRGAAMMRHDTGIVAHSIWKPWDSSSVAGYLFAVGQAPSWSCE